MKKLPKVTVSPEDLYNITIAPIRSKLLLTGIELRVFNHLSEPRSADAVADAIGTHPENTRRFLDGLAAIDLLLKKKGMYRNSPITQTFLVEDNQTYLGKFITNMALSYSSLENLTKLVKEGPPPTPKTMPMGPEYEEEMVAQGIAIMASTERAGDAQRAVEIVSKLPEFQSFRKMLDLGGGPGIIGIAIVASHSNMKGVIFDLPKVVEATKTFIKEYEMEDRVEVLGGDFNHVPIGKGYDLVWSSAALQFATSIDSVVKKVYESLNPDGVFVSIFPFGQTHEGTKPETTVLSLLSMALMGHDTAVDQDYIADSMLRVDFKSVQSQTLKTPLGPMELDIARK